MFQIIDLLCAFFLISPNFYSLMCFIFLLFMISLDLLLLYFLDFARSLPTSYSFPFVPIFIVSLGIFLGSSRYRSIDEPNCFSSVSDHS